MPHPDDMLDEMAALRRRLVDACTALNDCARLARDVVSLFSDADQARAAGLASAIANICSRVIPDTEMR